MEAPGGIEMDESFIYERLKALSGGLERSVYRDISKAFEEVVRYNEKALNELKQSLHRELRDVSERYNSFSGISADMDGQVKFIWRTEAVDAQNP